MINAGIEVLGFDGQQVFVSSSGLWEGIAVVVHYPEGQAPSTHPIEPGDIFIEPDGKAWRVTATALESDALSKFRITLDMLTGTASNAVSPSLGNTTRGAITTPKNGFVSPYWSTTLVAGECSRIAMILTRDGLSIPDESEPLPDDVWSGSIALD